MEEKDIAANEAEELAILYGKTVGVGCFKAEGTRYVTDGASVEHQMVCLCSHGGIGGSVKFKTYEAEIFCRFLNGHELTACRKCVIAYGIVYVEALVCFVEPIFTVVIKELRSILEVDHIIHSVLVSERIFLTAISILKYIVIEVEREDIS